MLGGIYKIVNTKNNKFYIGSSCDIEKRWRRHVKDLQSNRHHSIVLQRAWNKYGKDLFKLEIIELTKNLFQKEQFYLDNLSPKYNVGQHACGGDNISHHPNRTAICRGHSDNLKRAWKNADFRAAQMLRLSGRTNPNWRGGTSSPTCQKCKKDILFGHKVCMKCRDTSGMNNPFYGRKHTARTIQRLKALRQGKKPTNAQSVTINKISYASQADAAKAWGVSIGTMSNWITGKIQKSNILVGLNYS